VDTSWKTRQGKSLFELPSRVGNQEAYPEKQGGGYSIADQQRDQHFAQNLWNSQAPISVVDNIPPDNRPDLIANSKLVCHAPPPG